MDHSCRNAWAHSFPRSICPQNNQGNIQLLGGGLRAGTLHSRVCALEKSSELAVTSFSDCIPDFSSTFVDHLRARLTEPCTRGALKNIHQAFKFLEESSGTPATSKVSNTTIYWFMKQEHLQFWQHKKRISSFGPNYTTIMSVYGYGGCWYNFGEPCGSATTVVCNPRVPKSLQALFSASLSRQQQDDPIRQGLDSHGHSSSMHPLSPVHLVDCDRLEHSLGTRAASKRLHLAIPVNQLRRLSQDGVTVRHSSRHATSHTQHLAIFGAPLVQSPNVSILDSSFFKDVYAQLHSFHWSYRMRTDIFSADGARKQATNSKGLRFVETQAYRSW